LVFDTNDVSPSGTHITIHMIDPKKKKKLGDEEDELNPDAIDAALGDEAEEGLDEEDDEVPLVLDEEEETW